MGHQLSRAEADRMFSEWVKQYEVVAPKLMEGEGCFSDTDIIRYGKVTSLDEIVWDKKSDYSFKEAEVEIDNKNLKVAVIHTPKNIKKFIETLQK